jgi:hypothetical protein
LSDVGYTVADLHFPDRLVGEGLYANPLGENGVLSDDQSKDEERVMRRRIIAAIIVGCFCSTAAIGDPNTQIWYDLTDLGSGRWEYTYEVSNINLGVPIEEFTIWFDYGLYQNLLMTTPDPPAGNWDEIVWQPELGLGNGGYDALAIGLGINAGENICGFAVSFDWLGIGDPRSQYYEIIDPSTFETIESGWTVPEPATFSLLLLCTMYISVRRRRKSP